MQAVYLSNGSWSDDELDESHQGDTQDGGQCQAPTNQVSPPRVQVCAVRQGSIHHKAEYHDALQKDCYKHVWRWCIFQGNIKMEQW